MTPRRLRLSVAAILAACLALGLLAPPLPVSLPLRPTIVWAQSASNTQFGSNDNAGSASATIAAVNVTAGELLVTFVFNRQNAGQVTNGTATHGATSLGTPAIDDSAGDGVNVTVFCTLGLSGSQTVTVPFSASTLWHMYAVRIASPNTTTPCGTPSLASGGSSATAVSAAVSTASASDLVISAVLVRDLFAATLTPDAGQTQLLESTGTAAFASGTSTEPGTGGSVTSGWTWTGGIENRIVVMNLPATAGGGGGSQPAGSRRLRLFVGD